MSIVADYYHVYINGLYIIYVYKNSEVTLFQTRLQQS